MQSSLVRFSRSRYNTHRKAPPQENVHGTDQPHLAERYGYVNRALPDAELDGFVDALATRIASFDRQTLIETKALVNLASMPPDAEMQPGWDAFIASVQRPAAQARLRTLVEKDLQQVEDVEKHLGRYTAAHTQ